MNGTVFSYAIYSSLDEDSPDFRLDRISDAKKVADKDQILVVELSKRDSNGKLVIYQERILECPQIWIPTNYTPEYDGRYLAFVARTEPCGAIHNYQEVLSFDNAKWIVPDNVEVLKWMMVKNP